MKGDPQVISYLKQYLQIELTGHKQYLLHSQKCRYWGEDKLADIQADYSQEETEHAARLMGRLLFLEGQPDMQDVRAIEIKELVADQLTLDSQLISHAIQVLRDAVECSEQKADYVSRDLFRYMLDDEERHLKWVDTQLDLIAKIGIENYLQSST